MRSIVSLGDEQNYGRTLDVFVDLASWLVGVSWESHPGEASVSAHLGPLHATLWWYRKRRHYQYAEHSNVADAILRHAQDEGFSKSDLRIDP